MFPRTQWSDRKSVVSSDLLPNPTETPVLLIYAKEDGSVRTLDVMTGTTGKPKMYVPKDAMVRSEERRVFRSFAQSDRDACSFDLREGGRVRPHPRCHDRHDRQAKDVCSQGRNGQIGRASCLPIFCPIRQRRLFF